MLQRVCDIDGTVILDKTRIIQVQDWPNGASGTPISVLDVCPKCWDEMLTVQKDITAARAKRAADEKKRQEATTKPGKV